VELRKISGFIFPCESGLTPMHDRIISEGQARQILKNDLRRQALERYAAELNNATEQRRAEILAQIDGDIEEALRHRLARSGPFGLYVH
jgi:hypothetical protein